MYAFGEIGGFRCAVAQSECREHVAFAGGSHSRASAFECLGANLVPEITLRLLHLIRLGVRFYLGENLVDFFFLQIDYVVHQALGFAHIIAEKLEVELSVRGKGVFYK